jgi:hypothetical protein
LELGSRSNKFRIFRCGKAKIKVELREINKRIEMQDRDEMKLRKRIKFLIILFIVGLVLSGITAFPIETQLELAYSHISSFPVFLQDWITSVYLAVKQTNTQFPYLAYGTDWLAFAHIVIAVAFIGPLRDPVKNIWVIQFGMIACIMVFPLALIAGPIRGIPFYWQVIDCSFGVFGFALLYVCYRDILKLELFLSKGERK